MNIFFLVHYFPPQNNTGTRRVLAFCKCLTEAGHQVSVITTRKSVYESGALTEVVPDYIKLYEIPFSDQGNDIAPPIKSEPSGWKIAVGNFLRKCKRLSMKIFGQLVDSRLPFALSFCRPMPNLQLSQALSEADIIISSAPPWPVHLAAKILAKKYHIPWIADYRDQFSGWHKFQSNALTRFVEKKLDGWLISTADAVVTISEPMKSYYSLMHPWVCCIENGFEEESFASAITETVSQSDVVIRYMGSIQKDSIPYGFIDALNELPEDMRVRIKVEFYGDMLFLKSLFNKSQLKQPSNLTLFNQVSKIEAIKLMMTADLLYIKQTSDVSTASSKGMLTTKLFEYMAARKGIIAEVDEKTLIAEYVKSSGLDAVVSVDSSRIKNFLISYLKQPVQYKPNDGFINQFSRKKQSLRLLTFINEVLEKRKN